jgi:hypothetical protein
MKNLLKIITLLFLMVSFLQAFSQYTKWKRDTTFHGIEFKKVRFREDGKESLYAKGKLKMKMIIDGYPCHKKVVLTKDGHAKFFILAEDFNVAGNWFKKDTEVVIRSDSTFLIHCLYKPTVQGYQIKRTPYRSPFYVGSTNFQLYKSGKLLYFQPIDDIKIDDVWCRPSPARGGIHLFENGKLKECTSAKEQVIEGRIVEKNFELKFEKNGKLIFAEKLNFFGNIKD